MPWFRCQDCGEEYYSSASLQALDEEPNCDKCQGRLVEKNQENVEKTDHSPDEGDS